MKYENARDVLPEDLLKEVQRFVSGRILYIPSGGGIEETTSYKKDLLKRNQMIKNLYRHGTSIGELADQYYLSLDSIKKIVYGKKGRDLPYHASLESAGLYMAEGLLEEWGRSFLMFNCQVCGQDLTDFESSTLFGVVKLPLRLVQDQDEARPIKDKSDAPLIVDYKDGKFYVPYQGGKLQALKGDRINSYQAIVNLKKKDDYATFMKHYGRHLKYIE